MNAIISLVAGNIFGNLWTTSFGGIAIIQLVKPVLDKVAAGATVGDIVLSPEFSGLVAGITAVVSRDPHK